jgi:hypothetical protein
MFTATYITYVKYGFIMADLEEKCNSIKFCFKLKNNALETHQMLKTIFDDNSIHRTQTSDWFSPFEH